jgi:hydroxyethylthiazole kinase-like sugar kinase family protein
MYLKDIAHFWGGYPLVFAFWKQVPCFVGIAAGACFQVSDNTRVAGIYRKTKALDATTGSGFLLSAGLSLLIYFLSI